MLVGHNRIWNFLMQSAEKGRLAHAYLFLGAQGVGKKTTAIEFVKNLLCETHDCCGKCQHCRRIEQNQHPDVLIISPGSSADNKSPGAENSAKTSEIKIEQVRQLQRQISLSPFCASRKVVIIDGVEQMTVEAANCLLKTLEEPPQKSLLILISPDSRKIPPTIISRCQTIKFLPVKSRDIVEGLEQLGVNDRAKINQIVKFSCGRPGAAIGFLHEPGAKERRERLIADLLRLQKSDLCDKFKFAQMLSSDIALAQATLSDWLIWFRDRILEDVGLKNLMMFGSAAGIRAPLLKIKNILDAQRLLSENSFNHRLILESLLMKL